MLFATEMHENEHATHHTTWLASNAVKWLIEFLYQSVDLRSGPEPLVRQKDSLRWQGASGAIHVLVAGDAAQRSAESGVHVLYPLLRSYDGYPLVVAGLAINDRYLIRTSGIFITRLRHSR